MIKKFKIFLIDSVQGQKIILFFIFSSLLSFVLSTTDLYDKNHLFFESLELFFIFIFSIEYLLRIFYAKNKIREIFSFYTFVDLFAILPFYINLIFPFTFNFQFLRVFRVLRISKLFRYSTSFDLLVNVYKECKNIIKIVFGIIFVFVFISSSLICIFEPDFAPNFIEGLWWSLITMSTAGYGDVQPESILGRTLAGIVITGGVLFFAVITSVVSVSFIKEYERTMEDKHD